MTTWDAMEMSGTTCLFTEPCGVLFALACAGLLAILGGVPRPLGGELCSPQACGPPSAELLAARVHAGATLSLN